MSEEDPRDEEIRELKEALELLSNEYQTKLNDQKASIELEAKVIQLKAEEERLQKQLRDLQHKVGKLDIPQDISPTINLTDEDLKNMRERLKFTPMMDYKLNPPKPGIIGGST